MQSSLVVLLCVSLLAVGLGLMWVAMAVKIVPQYRRLVIFRLGRYLGERGPGLVLLLPFIDRGIPVDLREQSRDLTLQATTQDRAPVTLELSYTFQVTEPGASVTQVDDLETATRKLLHTHWQALAGTLTSADLPFRRQEIEITLRTRLDEASRRWGAKVTDLKTRDLK